MRIDKDIFQAVHRQFCLDTNMDKALDEMELVNISRSKVLKGSRIYGDRDAFFRAILYYGKAYIMVDDAIYDWAEDYFQTVEPAWFCNYRNLRVIDEKLREYGHELLNTHVYFLPDADAAKVEPLLPARWFEREEIIELLDRNCFSHALTCWETQPDMLAVAAMEQNKIAGLAGVSADGEHMWQIGIDVLPEYRGRGIAVNLFALMRQEILRRGKIPFGGTAESHAVSRCTIVKSGFLPAFTEVFSHEIGKPLDILNR